MYCHGVIVHYYIGNCVTTRTFTKGTILYYIRTCIDFYLVTIFVIETKTELETETESRLSLSLKDVVFS